MDTKKDKKYYACVNSKKMCEHRPFVAPCERYPEPNCVCGAWYEEVTEEQYVNSTEKTS